MNRSPGPENPWGSYDDPNWHAFRNSIVERDEYTCQECGYCAKFGLRVHHTYYLRNRKLWEYPLSACVTLCKKCHGKEHDNDTGVPLYVDVQDVYKLEEQIRQLEKRLPDMDGSAGKEPITIKQEEKENETE